MMFVWSFLYVQVRTKYLPLHHIYIFVQSQNKSSQDFTFKRMIMHKEKVQETNDYR